MANVYSSVDPNNPQSPYNRNPDGSMAGNSLLGGLFSSKSRADKFAEAENHLGRTDQSNFNLPGFAQTNQEYGQRADYMQGRQLQGGIRDPRQSMQLQNQNSLIGMLQQRAMGQGPSAAAEQARLAGQANIAGQMALARSAAPGQAGLAARAAAQQGGAQAGSIAAQSAVARAQEQAQAAQLLGSTIGQARQQDQAFEQLGMTRDDMMLARQLQQMGMNDQAVLELLRQRQQGAMAQQQGGMNLEQNRTNLMNILLNQQKDPSTGERILGGIAGLGGLVGSI